MSDKRVVNFNSVYNVIYSLYSKYINDPTYVYKRCGDNIVIMRLLSDTITNSNRKNITDPTNAKYRANKLHVELIFNQFDPCITINSITNIYYKKITYTVDTIAYPDKFNPNLDEVYTNGIHFYKNIIRAYFHDFDFEIDDNIIYTGEYIDYYDNGQIYEKCNYTDDKLNGEYIKYYENGQIYEKCNYTNGKINGEYINYYKCGQIYEKCNYTNGKINGEYINYYKCGQIALKCNYTNGKINGEYINYYKCGQIALKCNYTDYKLNGEYIKYYENGQISLKCNYTDDKLMVNL